jgi:hypothetical protein
MIFSSGVLLIGMGSKMRLRVEVEREPDARVFQS